VSHHVDDVMLRRFVLAEADEDEAVHIATHLDTCARCASRADALDPLAAAFAAVPEPHVPSRLMEQVLRAAAAPRVSWRGAALGASMLVAASAMFVVAFDPFGTLFQAAPLANLVPTVSEWVGGGVVAFLVLFLAIFLFAAGTSVAAVLSSRRAS
jgi:hypothetical protein